MKIAFIYGPFSVGYRYFDFKNLWNSSRGLTGSEISCIKVALNLADRGHDVALFAAANTTDCSLSYSTNGIYSDLNNNPNADKLDKVSIFPFRNIVSDLKDFDVVYAWNEPNPLRFASSSSLRILNQQLNDFSYCMPGFNSYTDIYTSPSRTHLEYISKLVHPEPTDFNKWRVIHNGCDVHAYSSGRKKRGVIGWISSPDRGLHLLLQEWGKIKERVPWAELRIYYHSLRNWINNNRDLETDDFGASIKEQARRARYVERAMDRLSHLDVRELGSTSRIGMIESLNEMTILAYCCDTVSFTEGFGVSVLEGMASKALPIITSCDAFGELYGGHCPMVEAPVRDRMNEWTGLVIKGLTDDAWREQQAEVAFKRALRFDWKIICDDVENLIKTELANKHRPIEVGGSL